MTSARRRANERLRARGERIINSRPKDGDRSDGEKSEVSQFPGCISFRDIIGEIIVRNI